MGYRLPGAFLALANRLLPFAAPGVAPSRSVRADGDPPDIREFAADGLVPAIAEHALALAKEFGTVAVIAADARVDELRRAIEDLGVVLAEPGEVTPDRPLVVLSARFAKGLEFDAVVVAEPAEIVASDPHGVRLLFVALTRAVQHLALAHSEPLPAVLLGAGPEAGA
jgi:DNA helicase IV